MEFSVNIRKLENGGSFTDQFIDFVEKCSWEECREHIAHMVRDWVFEDWEGMFAAEIDGKIIGMASFMRTDYYPITDIFPWISSIFVEKDYRGRKISGALIEHINSYAKALGFDRTYIPSEYTGLYEHFGYEYVKNITNYGGGVDRLYVKAI